MQRPYSYLNNGRCRSLITPFGNNLSVLYALREANFVYTPASIEFNFYDLFGYDDYIFTYWEDVGNTSTAQSSVTMNLDAQSVTSTPSTVTVVQETTGSRQRSTHQQTDITCPNENIISLTMPNDRISITSTEHHSISILNSVCALLLQNQASVKFNNTNLSTNSDNICRICFGGESAEQLVRPCSCRGTIAAVHRTCLERWLLQAATSYCELCRHHYAVTRRHKWSFMRSIAEWIKSDRGRALAADIWRAAALGTASVLGTARALHTCDKMLQAGVRRGGSSILFANVASSVLIGTIGALNGLLTTWMLLKIQEHQSSWQNWRESTLHLRVQLSTDEDQTITETEEDRTVEDTPAAARLNETDGVLSDPSIEIIQDIVQTDILNNIPGYN